MRDREIRLDWSRMLGFDQIDPATRGLGGSQLSKVGDKAPVRIGAKVSATKIGAKAGIVKRRP